MTKTELEDRYEPTIDSESSLYFNPSLIWQITLATRLLNNFNNMNQYELNANHTWIMLSQDPDAFAYINQIAGLLNDLTKIDPHKLRMM